MLDLDVGEVHQLQWELSRREVERAAFSNELAALTLRVEAQDKQLVDLANLKTEYDALLLLYGEKLEESQELRMDLQDVKDMYKAQVSVLNQMMYLGRIGNIINELETMFDLFILMMNASLQSSSTKKTCFSDSVVRLFCLWSTNNK